MVSHNRIGPNHNKNHADRSTDCFVYPTDFLEIWSAHLNRPERTVSTTTHPPSQRDKTFPNRIGPRAVSNIAPKLPAEPATAFRRPRAIWPWAWLALTGVATVGWFVAIGWTAFTLVRSLYQ